MDSHLTVIKRGQTVETIWVKGNNFLLVAQYVRLKFLRLWDINDVNEPLVIPAKDLGLSQRIDTGTQDAVPFMTTLLLGIFVFLHEGFIIEMFWTKEVER